MKSFRVFAAIVAALLGAALTGCGESLGSGKTGGLQVVYTHPPAVEISPQIKKVALAPFTAGSGAEARWGEVASDRIASALSEYNTKYHRFQLIDRQNLKAIIGERDLQLAVSSSGAASKLGQIAKVDALIFGDIKIIHRTPTVMKTEPRTTRNGLTFVQVPHKKLEVSVIMSFTIANVANGEAILARQLHAEFDSEKENQGSGFGSVIKSFMGGSEELASVDQAANILVDQCVQQFVKLVSPYEEKVSVKLEKGKTKAVAQGNKMAEANDFTGAMEKYEQALAEKSNDDGAAFNAGVVCELMGDTAKADKYYTQAIEMGDKPAYIEARSRLRKNLNSGREAASAPANPSPKGHEGDKTDTKKEIVD